MKKAIFCLLLISSYHFSSATVRLPGIFDNGMVLQRGIKIPVWGWADPNEQINIRFNKQSKSTHADLNGKWKILLNEEVAGGPYHLIVKGNNTIDFNDVLVGEVWLCSGQSNMEFTVSSGLNSKEEIASANYPMIRHVKISNAMSLKPLEDVKGTSKWKAALPADVGGFTAVGYFFARDLFNKLHIPIGLINSTWGGTDVETWTSKEAFEKSPEFKMMIKNVPHMNLDSFAAIKNKVVLDNVIKLQGNSPGSVDPLLWKENNYNDAGWPTMSLPGLWESKSLPDLDGIVWFRKTFNLTAGDIGKKSVLSLAMIDDNDETYINGVKVGNTIGYNVKRLYEIPAGLLKEGQNTIAIKVEDTGGGGGVYGENSDLYFSSGDKKIPLTGDWKFQVATIQSGNNALNPNSFPSLLFNAMINPLIPFGIKGALWYQGENNAGRAFQYRKAFPLMINDWRSRWNEGAFPFYFVQLASFNSANGNSNNGSTWAELREAQTLTLSLPNTGMAVTTDVGNPTDIHPKNKQVVGQRLAAVALKNVYGYKTVANGPEYSKLNISGNSISISFKNIGKGLAVHNGSSLLGFEIAGEDKKFYPGVALIKANSVLISSPSVPHPVAVHYAWSDDNGEANLINKDGFPANPFRTDHWKGITEKTKYMEK